MRPFAPLMLVAVGILGAGCVRTSITSLDLTPRPRIEPEQVQVFLQESDVPGPFTKVALINAEGPTGYTSENGMIQKARKKAAQLGANGLVLNQMQEPSAGSKVAGAIFGVPAQRHGSMVAISFRQAAGLPADSAKKN